MQAKTRKVALAEGLTAGILFGTASIMIRFLGDVDAFSIAFWRTGVAVLVLLAILAATGRPFKREQMKRNWKDLFVLGFLLALHFIFFASSVKDTTILNATVLVNTTPVFSMIVSASLFKTKPARLAIIGLAVSFIGVSIIAYAESALPTPQSAVGQFSPSLKGDLEAVLAAVVEAFYLNYGRRIRAEMDILVTMVPVYTFTALIAGIFAVPLMGKALVLPTDVAILIPLIGLAVLPTAIAHTLYFSSLSNLKSFQTATLALLESIGATLLGIALFQEVPAPIFVAGATLILLGIVFTVKEE